MLCQRAKWYEDQAALDRLILGIVAHLTTTILSCRSLGALPRTPSPVRARANGLVLLYLPRRHASFTLNSQLSRYAYRKRFRRRRLTY